MIKSKKRGQNEGSIRKRTDGRWEARYTAGYHEDGKPIRKSIMGKTREQVATSLSDRLSQKTILINSNHKKFVDWLSEWLETYAKNDIKLSTYNNYERYINRHIKPQFKDILLSSLKTEHLQKFINYKISDGRLDEKNGGLSPKTIKNILNMIHAALEQAVINELLLKNVSNGVRLPKITKKEMRVLSKEEQNLLIEHCKNERLGIIPILDLFTGMRLGEILALHWNEINFTKKELLVKYGIKRLPVYDKDVKTEIILDTPKTPNSIRTIPLIKPMVTLLKEHKKIQYNEKKIAGNNYIDNDFVFCNELGLPYDQRTFKDTYQKFLHATKLDVKINEKDENITFHTLRHTFATRSLELGMDILVLSKIMGHADVSTTLNKYGHVLPNHKRESMDKLEAIYA